MDQSTLVIQITDSEENQAKRIAYDRDHCSASSVATESKLVSKEKSDLDRMTEGVRAEIAVGKILNLDLNNRGTYDPRGDGGFDFKVGEDTIDVKWTNRIGGNLIFRSLESFKSTLAVLCEPAEEGSRKIRVVGFITRNEFNRVAKALELTAGQKNFLAERQHLKPFSRIVDFKRSLDRAAAQHAEKPPPPKRGAGPKRLNAEERATIVKLVTTANKISDDFAQKGFSGNVYQLAASNLPADYQKLHWLADRVEREPTNANCASFLRHLQNLHLHFARVDSHGN